jgi:peptidoglycan hydrolase-like protein with peptidoglycan-binding domain
MSVTGATLEAVLRTTGLELVTRAEWGARAAKRVVAMPYPSPRWWAHHAAVESTDDAREVRAHQAFHMDSRGWLDIAYNFLIPDPNPGLLVFEGRGVGVQGGHTAYDNHLSHAFCLMGNFQVDVPSPSALDAIVRLTRLGRDRGWWEPTLGGHRDAPRAATSCPGNHLYARLPDLRARVAGKVAPPAPLPTGDRNLKVTSPYMRGADVERWQLILAGAGLLSPGDVDAVYGPQTEQATRLFQLKLRVASDGVVGPKTREAAGRLLAWLGAVNTGVRPPAPAYPGLARLRTPYQRGPIVKAWQHQLNLRRGYGLLQDGIYGLATNHVVWHFQRTHGLVADAIAGPATWRALTSR